jgi:hypothetical protein
MFCQTIITFFFGAFVFRKHNYDEENKYNLKNNKSKQ